MNVSASGLSKILLQVIRRDFSKFSPVKIRPFFPAIAFAFIASTFRRSPGRDGGGHLLRAITPRWSLVSPDYGYGPG